MGSGLGFRVRAVSNIDIELDRCAGFGLSVQGIYIYTQQHRKGSYTLNFKALHPTP